MFYTIRCFYIDELWIYSGKIVLIPLFYYSTLHICISGSRYWYGCVHDTRIQWFNDRRCHCMSECVYCSITSYDCQLISMFRHWSTTKIMSMTQSLDTLYVNINKYQSGRMIMVILTRSNRYIFKSKLMSGRWTVVVLLCTCTTENYG